MASTGTWTSADLAPKAFIRRYPLATFLALTFAISWGEILLVIGLGGVPLTAENIGTLITLGYPAMLAAPSMAGLLLTGLVHGKTGFRDLLARFRRWRVGARWYAIALLTAPVSMLTVLLVLSLVSPAFRPLLFVTKDPFGLLQFSVVVGLLVGVFEELGWTGFALPELLRRYHDVLGTGLVIGFAYAAWQLLIVWVAEASGPTAGGLPLAIYLVATVFTWQPAYRLLMVWVYRRTESLSLSMLMSASLVLWWNSLNNPATLTQTTLAAFYLILAVIWFACGAAAAMTTRPKRKVLVAAGQSNVVRPLSD